MANLKLKSLIKENTMFSTQDDLLRGITFEDLITAVESNEKVYIEGTVKKVFDEMLQTNLQDAHALLKANMRNILKELTRIKSESNITEAAIDKDLEDAIKKNIIAKADENYNEWGGASGVSSNPKAKPEWELMPGSKFIRIVRTSWGSRSAWGFVAKDDGVFKGIPYKKGDVFKVASWNAPAKHVRGSAYDENVNWKWTGPDYLR